MLLFELTRLSTSYFSDNSFCSSRDAFPHVIEVCSIFSGQADAERSNQCRCQWIGLGASAGFEEMTVVCTAAQSER